MKKREELTEKTLPKILLEQIAMRDKLILTMRKSMSETQEAFLELQHKLTQATLNKDSK